MEQLTTKLCEALRQEPQILAAWLGGSAATGRIDQYSDTDLVIISQEGTLPFQIIEETLPEVEFRWIVKDGPYNQRFYVLKDSSDTFYIDVVVFSGTDPALYREYFNEARHGKPEILFDKNAILKEASKAPHIESHQIDAGNELGRTEIIYRTFLKEKLRGKYIDAFTFYHRLVLIYTSVVRTKYAPQKHDFNLRYVYNDLPPEEAQFLEKLLKVDTLEQMHSNADIVRKRIHTELKGFK